MDDDPLFKFNESTTAGAILWQKRALEAERMARMNATECDVQGRKNDELQASLRIRDGRNKQLEARVEVLEAQIAEREAIDVERRAESMGQRKRERQRRAERRKGSHE